VAAVLGVVGSVDLGVKAWVGADESYVFLDTAR